MPPCDVEPAEVWASVNQLTSTPSVRDAPFGARSWRAQGIANMQFAELARHAPKIGASKPVATCVRGPCCDFCMFLTLFKKRAQQTKTQQTTMEYAAHVPTTPTVQIAFASGQPGKRGHSTKKKELGGNICSA